MLNLKKKKWESKNCRLCLFQNPQITTGFHETRTLWLSGRVFDFLTQKMLRMVKSLAALCTVSSEQATLYNCGCVLKLFFFLSLKHKLLYEGDIDCL
jgi:hypothetical protein